MYVVCMSKNAMLSDEAYAALQAQKTKPSESLSAVILRFVPRPIRTFGDLERHLEQMDGPIIPDLSAVRRVRRSKKRHAD